jgi:hypothetical protein
VVKFQEQYFIVVFSRISASCYKWVFICYRDKYCFQPHGANPAQYHSHVSCAFFRNFGTFIQYKVENSKRILELINKLDEQPEKFNSILFAWDGINFEFQWRNSFHSSTYNCQQMCFQYFPINPNVQPLLVWEYSDLTQCNVK